MACLSGDLGALPLGDSNALSVVLVLRNLPRDLLALLLWHLLTFSLGHPSLNLILDCVATFLGDSDTDISLNIMTLLFRYSVFDLLWSVEALLLGDSLALLSGYILALLPGHLLALLSSDVNTNLLWHVIAVLLGHNSSDSLFNILALFIVCILLGYILTNLSWHVMALLPGLVPTLLLGHVIAHHLGHVVARLSWFIPALLLGHILADHVWHVMALFSRLVPTFFFVNVLAVHGRNICTLLFTISIPGTHRLLYKITLSNCLSGAHTLIHSITHLLYTRLTLSDQLLGTHSFIVGCAHFFRYRVALTLILGLALSVIFCFTLLISNSMALFLLLSLCNRLGHLLALHGRGIIALLFHHHITHVLSHSLLLGFHLSLTFLLLLSMAFFFD